MNLTTKQIKAILDGAPDKANHVEHTGLNLTAYLFMPRGDGTHKIWANDRWVSSDNRRMEQCWPIHALSDLREILSLRQEVERLKGEQSKVIEDSLDWLGRNYPNACQPACGLLQHYANQLREQGNV